MQRIYDFEPERRALSRSVEQVHEHARIVAVLGLKPLQHRIGLQNAYSHGGATILSAQGGVTS